jgi:F-type H+-transporting ATPase subunit b
MGSFLSIDPGLLFWSIINFLFFLIALYLIGAKGFIKNITDREHLIQEAIDKAEEQKLAIERFEIEHKEKMKEATQTIDAAMKQAKERSDIQAKQIIDDAQKVKEKLLNEATIEIERSKQSAISQIRAEVADLVVESTEKIIYEKLDSEKDIKLVNLYIDQLSKN